jgi:hypothetical protein
MLPASAGWAGFRRVALIAELPDAANDAAGKDDDRNG